MNAARAKRQEVLVTFNAHRGCFVNNKYSKKTKACKAPSAKAYKAAVKALPQGVPVREDVRAVERGQPRLAADVPQAEAGGAVLQGA